MVRISKMKQNSTRIVFSFFLIVMCLLLINPLDLRGEEAPPILTIHKILQVFEDRERGGVYHTFSEDLTKVINPNKYSLDHFAVVENHLVNFLLRGDAKELEQAEKLMSLALDKFEDKGRKGFFTATSKNWVTTDDSKDTAIMAKITQVLFLLYECTMNEKYLLKGFDTLDLLLSQGWDEKDGGFFNSFTADWGVKSSLKTLPTHIQILLALEAGWKNGLDSKYAGKAEYYRQRARELADLIEEKMYDTKYGGFFTSCNSDWSVKDSRKNTEALFRAVAAFSIHYNQLGPMIFGPRKGSLSYYGKAFPSGYVYRGPAPNPDLLGMDAYHFIKLAGDVATLLIKKAWDDKKGGFYNICSQEWEPVDANKEMLTHAAAINGLNTFYRSTGMGEYKEKLNQVLNLLDDKAEGEVTPGFFDIYNFNWEPIYREKNLFTNLETYSAISSARPTLKTSYPRIRFKVWVDPDNITIREGEAAEYKITIQNQGFTEEKVRIGGFTSLSSWISPKELFIEIPPHQIVTYTLQVRPPFGLMHKKYPFEITVVPARDTSQYFTGSAGVTIE
jgi:mannose/cellobiose epimerase-like protein (N-acyl-D-glucosamine 2-epimerase family)